VVYRVLSWVVLVTLTAGLTLTFGGGRPVAGQQATQPPTVSAQATAANAQQLLQQGREAYKVGQWEQAIQYWQQALTLAKAQGDRRTQAMTLSNLSLAYQQLGDWPAATTAIATAFRVLGAQNTGTAQVANNPTYQPILAQVFNTQGKLQFATGQFEPALKSWQDASRHYTAAQDQEGMTRSLLNQSQAMRVIGLNRRAGALLEPLYKELTKYPPQLQLAILLNYGDTLRLLGRLSDLPPDAQSVLQQGLGLAQQLHSSADIASFLLSLGNTAQSQQLIQATQFSDQAGELKETYQKSLQYYQRTVQAADPVAQKVQVWLQEQSALVDATPLSPAKRSQVDGLTAQIQTYFDHLSSNVGSIYVRLQLAENLLKLGEETASNTAIQLLAAAAQQAERLGNFQIQSYALWRKYYQQALEYYRQAAKVADPTSLSYIQALLNQQSLLLAGQEVEPYLLDQAKALSGPLQTQLDRLPVSHKSLYARLHFAQNLSKLNTTQSRNVAIQLLRMVAQQAESLNDTPAQSYALGYLGSIYEQNQQWQSAQTLTQQALSLAKAVNVPHFIYQWQWQLGRLLKAQNDTPAAIEVYTQAVGTLDSVRKNLATLNTDNADVQFLFRLNAEPVYLDLVELLLMDNSYQPSNQNLERARSVVESLQIAELENFFQEACAPSPVTIEGIDSTAAVLYPIILKDRLDVILSLYDANAPQRIRLRHYSLPITAREVELITSKFRQSLIPSAPYQDHLILGQKLYSWLIRPAEADLAQAGAKTLVFIMNGNLRNVPMAALHDGKQFLIQKYRITLSPGLRLIKPQPLADQTLKALVAGLTESTQGFPALPNVEMEVENIQALLPNSRIILNESLTNQKLTQELDSASFNVIHLATHGQFSSNIDQTFILTWNQKMNVKQFDTLLRTVEKNDTTPLDLLVLSACQTASGDKRAALGLAGIAVRSGARSTVASLWPVNDQTTADFMTFFYQALNQPGVSKAEALSIAQLKLLAQDPSPYYWAPFVLVGNWL